MSRPQTFTAKLNDNHHHNLLPCLFFDRNALVLKRFSWGGGPVRLSIQGTGAFFVSWRIWALVVLYELFRQDAEWKAANSTRLLLLTGKLCLFWFLGLTCLLSVFNSSVLNLHLPIYYHWHLRHWTLKISSSSYRVLHLNYCVGAALLAGAVFPKYLCDCSFPCINLLLQFLLCFPGENIIVCVNGHGSVVLLVTIIQPGIWLLVSKAHEVAIEYLLCCLRRSCIVR